MGGGEGGGWRPSPCRRYNGTRVGRSGAEYPPRLGLAPCRFCLRILRFSVLVRLERGCREAKWPEVVAHGGFVSACTNGAP